MTADMKALHEARQKYDRVHIWYLAASRRVRHAKQALRDAADDQSPFANHKRLFCMTELRDARRSKINARFYRDKAWNDLQSVQFRNDNPLGEPRRHIGISQETLQ